MGNEVGTEIPEDDDNVDVGNVTNVDEVEDDVDDDEVDADDDFSDTVILSGASEDDVDDTISTAEINVERLIAELGDTDEKDACRRKEIRRRLEEMAEEKSFEDTYAIDFGSD
jgi:hypothetical protein